MTDELPGAVRAELTRLRAERVAFTEERERLRTELRESELQIRELTKHRDQLVKQVEKLAGVAERAELARELDATRATVSWRVTAPLRAVRRRTS